METAIKNSCIRSVKQLLNDGFYPDADHIQLAIDMGNVDILKLLFQYNNELGCLDSAAQLGHIEMVKYVVDGDTRVDENGLEIVFVDIIDDAVVSGKIELVEYLHNLPRTKHSCSTDAIDLASKHGYFDIVRFLYENRSEGFTSNAIKWASENKHFDIVEYLLHDKSSQ